MKDGGPSKDFMLRKATLISAAAVLLLFARGAGSIQVQKPSHWAIDNARIGPESPIEIPAGGTYAAQVMYPNPDGPLSPLKADVVWWIEPYVKGILIEAKTGTIMVSRAVPHGTEALLHADIAGRKEKLHAKIFVYSPEKNPLVGTWRIESTLPCGRAQAATYSGPQADMNWKFHVDNEFWIGREFNIAAGTVEDGTYKYDASTSTLRLKTKWPAGKVESSWNVILKDGGDSAELKARVAHAKQNAFCGYVLSHARKLN